MIALNQFSNAQVNSLVQTDMGNGGARAFGLEEAPTTLKDSSNNTAHIVSARSHMHIMKIVQREYVLTV